MYWQSSPEGQHIMDVALLSGMHLLEGGQQKSEGSLESPHEV